MSIISAAVQAQISSSTEENIADFSPFLNKDAIDHKRLAEANRILRSGSCTSLIMCYTKNLTQTRSYLPEASLFSEAQEIASGFFKTVVELFHSNALNNVKTIQIEDYVPLITDEFYQAISLLPQLHTVKLSRVCRFSSKQFLILLGNPSIKKMEIGAIYIGLDIDCKKLQEITAISQIENLGLHNCRVTDPMLEALSTSRTLQKLNLAHNREFTSRGLQAIANNSVIIDIILDCTAHDVQGTLALIHANRLQSLTNPIPEYTDKLDETGDSAYERRHLTAEEFELLDKAFEENTSILRVGITSRWMWPARYPCRSFHEPISEEERLLSVPIEPDGSWRFDDAYTYTPRNLALKAACESVEVFNQIKINIMTPIVHCLESAKDVVPIITAYALPNGKELLNVFSEEEAEQLFPKQLPILRQFGLYKKGKASAHDSSVKELVPITIATYTG